MRERNQKAVIAGHICVDVIPTFDSPIADPKQLLRPGNLVQIGPLLISTGGAVPNTGLALLKLGMNTALAGKAGNDSLGQEMLRMMADVNPSLVESMIVDSSEQTSYTFILNLPGVDRIFWHYPGANRTFSHTDIADRTLADATIFHFGYPPYMDRLLIGNGEEMELLLQRVKRHGLTTTLDMAKPDPQSFAGQVDWNEFLSRILPHVDVFLPGFEELWMMMEPEYYRLWNESSDDGDISEAVDAALLRRLSDRLIERGCGVVAIKLGDQGLYVRTSGDPERLQAMGKCAPTVKDSWLNREYLAPCFQVQVVGTTGSGDCTIAGFIAGMMNDWSLEKTMTFAVAVGAFNVETADATSGIPDGRMVEERIESGWSRLAVKLSLPGWNWDEYKQIYVRE